MEAQNSYDETIFGHTPERLKVVVRIRPFLKEETKSRK